MSEPDVEDLINRWVAESGDIQEEAESSFGAEPSWSPFDEVLGTFYEILGVPEDATADQIRIAYDAKHIELKINCRDERKRDALWPLVYKAHECLKDPVKRKQYDKKLHDPGPVPDGEPQLVVECQPAYTFSDVRKGAVILRRFWSRTQEEDCCRGALHPMCLGSYLREVPFKRNTNNGWRLISLPPRSRPELTGLAES